MDTPVLADQELPYICVNTGYSLEDQPGAMDDRDEW